MCIDTSGAHPCSSPLSSPTPLLLCTLAQYSGLTPVEVIKALLLFAEHNINEGKGAEDKGDSEVSIDTLLAPNDHSYNHPV